MKMLKHILKTSLQIGSNYSRKKMDSLMETCIAGCADKKVQTKCITTFEFFFPKFQYIR